MAWYIRAYGNDDALTYSRSRMRGLPCGDLPEANKQRQEIDTVGFPISFHPLHLFRNQIEELNPQPLPAAKLRDHLGESVVLVGYPIAGKSTVTRKGEPMEFVSLEDETDTFEATLFPKAYRRFCQMVSFSRPLVITGVVEEQFEAVSVRVEELRAL
jgi:DNA polymerase III alpha subunit